MIPLICDPWAAFGTTDSSANQNAVASGDNFDFGSAFAPSQKIITEKKAPARPPPGTGRIFYFFLQVSEYF